MPEPNPVLKIPSWKTAVQIEITKWDKYNPRTDAKSWAWFRMQNDFFEDPDLFDVGATGLLCFIYLCCLRSKSGPAAVFKVNPRQMAQKCRCDIKAVLMAIDELAALEKIVIREAYVDVRGRTDPNVDVRERPDPYPTNVTERNGTNGTNGTLATVKPPRARPRVDPKPLKATHSESDLAVGSSWLEYALVEMPWKSDDPSWTALAFAEGLAKVRRATGVSDEGLVELLRFVSADDFWRDKACSPAGLLKKSARNGERKIDNILVRMRTKTDRAVDALSEWVRETSCE